MELEEIVALFAGFSALAALAGLFYGRSKDKREEADRKLKEEMAHALEMQTLRQELEFAKRERDRLEADFKNHDARSPELLREVATLSVELKNQDSKIDALDQKFDRRMDSLKEDLERMMGK